MSGEAAATSAVQPYSAAKEAVEAGVQVFDGKSVPHYIPNAGKSPTFMSDYQWITKANVGTLDGLAVGARDLDELVRHLILLDDPEPAGDRRTPRGPAPDLALPDA